jgi:scyllo-inositol 2-dehydrogenase (NADP+)
MMEYTLQIVSSDIVEVSGFATKGVWASSTRWGKDTIEDEGTIHVRYASGAWSSLTMTSIGVTPRPWLQVTGTRGSWMEENGWCVLTTPGKGGTVSIRKERTPHDEWPRFYQNIAGHLMRGEKLVITPEWARRPIHVIDLAYKSAAAGKAMKARYA